MQDKCLHIVSFNVPWPADYGGVIDVFHRIRTLHNMGVCIYLHCYDYGRGVQDELNSYCKQVYYYRRDMSPTNLFTSEPFIVSSRLSQELLARLQDDGYPVLLEGLHCCGLLEDLRRQQPERLLLVRAHNVEHEYYSRLSKSERRLSRKIYLAWDARKLKKYEPVLKLASCVLAVTEQDLKHFEAIGCQRVLLMPSSHNSDRVEALEGRGDYVLYHADLSVPENVEAATFLVEQVLRDDTYPLVLAGRNPDKSLRLLVKGKKWIRLIENPADDTMEQLQKNAQITILVTRQATGLKLKLLNSLYRGRFCVVDPEMVAGTPLGALCTVCSNPEEMRLAIQKLFPLEFTSQDIENRAVALSQLYDNARNGEILIKLLITS